MLFLVPDADAADATAAPASAQEKAPPGRPAGFKVELDLDDAPFLEEEPPAPEEPEPAPEEQQVAPPPAPSEAPPTLKDKLGLLLARFLANKKRLIIAGGSGALLLVAAIVINVVFSGEKEPPAPAPAEPRRVTVPAERPPEEPAGPAPVMVSFDPFLVERRGPEGEIRFLRIQFSIPVTEEDQGLFTNLVGKRVTIRDAVYYYLANKPLTFLQDRKTQEAIKSDIISVINEHISPSKVKELYLEDYLVTTP